MTTQRRLHGGSSLRTATQPWSTAHRFDMEHPCVTEQPHYIYWLHGSSDEVFCCSAM